MTRALREFACDPSSAGGARESEGSGRALVDDAPAPVLAGPVLALSHGVREIVGAVILLEADHHQILFARIAEDADVSDRHLDPGLAGVHLPLVAAPCRQGLAVRREAAGVMAQVALRVPAFPV